MWHIIGPCFFIQFDNLLVLFGVFRLFAFIVIIDNELRSVILLDFFLFVSSILEKAMAPHSSTLAWRIPGTGEPGGLPSMGSHRVGHD